MHILYAESDYFWASCVSEDLARHGKVTLARTEQEFRAFVDRTAAAGQWPDIVVLEQRMRWTDAAPAMPPALKEVVRAGAVHAGARCYLYFRQAGGRAPIIFYSDDPIDHLLECLSLEGAEQGPEDFQCVEKDDTSETLEAALILALR